MWEGIVDGVNGGRKLQSEMRKREARKRNSETRGIWKKGMEEGVR